MFEVYSRDGCPYCTKVVQVLQLAELKFVEHKLGRDFTRDEFYNCLLYTSPSPRD